MKDKIETKKNKTGVRPVSSIVREVLHKNFFYDPHFLFFVEESSIDNLPTAQRAVWESKQH